MSSSSPIGGPPSIYGGGGDGEGCFIFISIILGILVLFGLPIYFFTKVHQFLGADHFWFIIKNLLFVILIIHVPTVSNYISNNWILTSFLECILYSLSFIGAIWLFNININYTYLTYGIIIIFIILVGGLINKFRAAWIMFHIKPNIDNAMFDNIVSNIRKTIIIGNFFYLAIPISLITGTILGTYRKMIVIEIIKLNMELMIIISIIILCVALINNFIIMVNPLIKVGKSFNKSNWKKVCFAAMQGRKIFLYCSIHDVILFIVFSAILLEFWGGIGLLSVNYLFYYLILTSAIFNEVPYIIGQYRLRQRILGIEVSDDAEIMTQALEKLLPLFPVPEFIKAISFSGTIGFLMYFILRLLYGF